MGHRIVRGETADPAAWGIGLGFALKSSMNEKIILPLDGSTRAEAIVIQFKRLLAAEGTQCVVVHAVEPILPLESGGMDAAWQILWDAGQTYAQEITARLRARGIQATSIVRPGRPAEVALEVAEEEQATMMALTTHGRSGIARWAFGSVGEKLLRAARVPVLLTRSFASGEESAPFENPMRRILLPISAGSRSLEIVGPVIKLARRYGSKVRLLHVRERAGDRPVPEADTALSSFEKGNVPVEFIHRSGDPAAEILDESARSRADLVAMTTHGRSGPTRWILGSVAEKVLRSGSAPLLLVRGFSPSTLVIGA